RDEIWTGTLACGGRRVHRSSPIMRIVWRRPVVPDVKLPAIWQRHVIRTNLVSIIVLGNVLIHGVVAVGRSGLHPMVPVVVPMIGGVSTDQNKRLWMVVPI